MVLQGEGRGKISSPHSVNILGTKSLPKWGGMIMDWIIILFFIYLDAFRVEKIGGINLQGHFNGRSQFGKLGGLKPSKAILRHQMDIFWVPKLNSLEKY
jgi:hypothetical protein